MYLILVSYNLLQNTLALLGDSRLQCKAEMKWSNKKLNKWIN